MTSQDIYNQILITIWNQREHMIKQFGVEPNKVILGSTIMDWLKCESGLISLEQSSGEDNFVYGLRVVPNIRDRYAIEVCYVHERDNMMKTYIDQYMEQLRKR